MRKNDMPRVVVGLSGGVDSSVAAMLLKQQGYEVIGLFMRNWNDESIIIDKQCSWIEDSIDAMLVAQQLNIPFQIVDMSKMYKKRIVDYMFKEYASGRTPNPDILCNREIKFDLFLKKALSLKADFIATGHYVRCKKSSKDQHALYRLLSGVDKQKDQSYFLCQLNQLQLSKSLFPLGNLEKKEVRKYAEKAALVTAKKKDSQGLCFIGKVRLPEFLQQKLKPKTGDIIEIPPDTDIYDKQKNFSELNEEKYAFLARNYIYNKTCGKVIGKHLGAHYFTKGQRKGLGIGGHTEGLFVIDTDIKQNIVYVGMGKNHPGLYKGALFVKENDIHWLRKDLELNKGEKLKVKCRIRYRQSLQSACLYKVENGLYAIFEKSQVSITEGQFAAWYIDEELIGSGVIS
ncbi:tRNA 2-thiouridine(34) synthase MnmA [Bacteroidetes bacterium endosymbiont of Geopemphigus sp.]|uniref:tRNA 2-thiouridine(34) synthase MnmA n=1 Tax=Bacteroidetes bacterium endosymbiont of Geopemphigus sp. TaxID=2047937 RepID=UPI0022445749|nr:tRNA 2-thiouridine(34) synthase MnmA [Bacteroidetes bacterium endosymbiont of Geopemphigus sp.]